MTSAGAKELDQDGHGMASRVEEAVDCPPAPSAARGRHRCCNGSVSHRWPAATPDPLLRRPLSPVYATLDNAVTRLPGTLLSKLAAIGPMAATACIASWPALTHSLVAPKPSEDFQGGSAMNYLFFPLGFAWPAETLPSNFRLTSSRALADLLSRFSIFAVWATA